MYKKDVIHSRRQVRDYIDVHRKRKFHQLNNSKYLKKFEQELDTFKKIDKTFKENCLDYRQRSFDSLVNNALKME